ncbi:MAG: glycosyltransferase family 2 protein [Armatimonadota bacterium]|nr:glycosyltransferase family 2 protein [Armatimonadota bacterium]MDR7452003.1 glycosyltransferase family 2 protein [Armatimonadota bacterium]MDR7467894.1 glycosyltransferase family 2 protein [Armatimonadota bacterium]MDR7494253.1 glycosyltransferase family 2 protein [Armatimonadota bacterium]MDR7500034.1 glycosyltransferase family 2 protein [Armatimonadota bacterium]
MTIPIGAAGNGGSNPLVSLVTPAYNQGPFLREAVESVLAQTYPAVEYIVIDDGSTDNTREILSAYGGRVRWESQPNRGQAATLNRGWSMARGDLLGYLSADDVLLPDAVEAGVRMLMGDPRLVAVYPDFYLIDRRSRLIKEVRRPDFDYRDLVLRGVCHPGPGALFRRTAYLRAGPWDETLRQAPDYEFWLRLGLLGGFGHIPRPLAKFRIHGGSQSRGPAPPARSDEIIRIIAEFYAQRSDLPAEILRGKRQALSTAYLLAARSHFGARRYTTAMQRVWRAAALYPRHLLSPGTYRLLLGGLTERWRYQLP